MIVSIQKYSTKLVKSGVLRIAEEKVQYPSAARNVVQSMISDMDREHMVVVFLDVGTRVLGANIAAVGSLSGLSSTPREIFKAAILTNAYSIVLGHNHPSGDPTPSKDDVEFTKKIAEASKVIGIGILDHVIVTKMATTYSSFAELGLL